MSFSVSGRIFGPWLLTIVLMLSFVQNSGGSESPIIVDFGKTIPVARPGEELSDRPSLRVAVEAMISPKEKFVYYRLLLDYLASNLGREVQLVQRKTYREVNELIGKSQIDLAFICSGPFVSGKEQYAFVLKNVRKIYVFLGLGNDCKLASHLG